MIGTRHTRARRAPLFAGALLACAVAVAALLAISGALPTRSFASSAQTGSHGPVILVLAPFVTFANLSPTDTPALWRTIELGAVGAMNARTADLGWPRVSGGALTLAASRWAIGPSGGPLDATTLDRARSANASSLAPPAFGALGSAIHAAGGRTIALGASDTDTSTAEGRLRYAELVAADASGTLDTAIGDVLTADPKAPYGLRTDSDALGAALDSVIGTSSAMSSAEATRALIVIDVGDLSRAHDESAPAGAYRAAHRQALRTLDSAVADARAAADRTGGLLLIVPVATDKARYEDPYFGPFVVYGQGWSGTILSASTRRDGLATNLDVAPTALAALGIPTPDAMLGKPLSSRADTRGAAFRIAGLARTGTSVGAMDRLRDEWFQRWFCWSAGVIVLLAAAVALGVTEKRLRGSAMFAEVALDIVLSALPAAWLMFALNAWPESVAEALHSYLIALAAVAGVSFALRSWFSATRIAGPLFLTSLTTLVVLADQWLGHPIESGLFSYSTAAGWRFYGMGNEGAAIAVGASIAAVALLADALAEKPAAAAAVRRFGVPLVGLVVLVTAAAPFAGANAGVAVWGIVAYAVAWAAMNGVKFSWRVALLTALAIVVAVSAFAAIDLARPNGGGTHLARFASGILHGDLRSTGELVWRKLQNNIDYLPQTPYTSLAVALGLALAALRFAPSRPLRLALEIAPTYGAAMLGLLVGGLAAWATEDSGIVMPALMLLAGAVPLLILALRSQRGD